MLNNSIWQKSAYEIKEIAGIEFIDQIKGGEKNHYKPLEYQIPKRRPEIPNGQLKISPHIDLYRINPDDHDEILQFVNTWGLLGLRHTKSYGDLKIIIEIFNRHNLIFNYSHLDELYKNSKDPDGERRNREPLIVFQDAVRSYQQIAQGISFYFEGEGLIKGFRSFKKQNEFKDKVIQVEDTTKKNYEGMKQMEARELVSKETHLFIVFENLNRKLLEVHPQFFVDTTNYSISKGWRFNSLLAAAYLRIALDIEEGKKLIHCSFRKCNKLFIPNRPDNQHCSDTCKDSDKTNRANQRKWLTEAKETYNTYPAHTIEKIFNSLIQEGVSGRLRILNKIRSELEKEIK